MMRSTSSSRRARSIMPAALLEAEKRLAGASAECEEVGAGVLAARKAAYVKARADAEQAFKQEAIARKVAPAARQ